MAFDQPGNRPFASIFSDDNNQSGANEPMDRGGQSYTYSNSGRSASDNAISKNDKSPFTDVQPKQAASTKTGDRAKGDEGEDPKGVNRLDGAMIDEERPKTIKSPIKPAVKKATIKPAKKTAAKKTVAKKKNEASQEGFEQENCEKSCQKAYKESKANKENSKKGYEEICQGSNQTKANSYQKINW
jgi:hypothetical protein